MSAIGRITADWQEDGSVTLLARVCSRDATGQATGIKGEGRWVKQADLSTITCKVFDRSGDTPDTAIASPTVTISSVIQDTPVTDGELWDGDITGYQFRLDLAGSCFPTGGHKYLVELYFTTTGGKTWTLQYEGVASPVVGS